jgi:hypothetical protein
LEETVDALIEVVTAWSEAMSADGGIADVMTVNSIYWGDPGQLPQYAYPSVYVQPTRDEPDIETTGYEVVNLSILIGIMIDAREFFDASVEEATGDRNLTRAAASLRRWLRRETNRTLDGSIRELKVLITDYVPEVRGEVIVKSAQLSLVVNTQYQRQQ